MEDPTLKALVEATGHTDIAARPSGYVIRFNAVQRGFIRGLCRNQDTFYLAFDEFDEVPISFLLEDYNGTTYQYWTLKKHMHREDGPAFIAYNPVKAEVTRKNYYYGLPHSDNGPAIEHYQGFSVDVDTFPNHFHESWDKAKFEWFYHGKNRQNNVRWATSVHGDRYKRKKGNVLDSPEGFGPTFFSKALYLEWCNWLYVAGSNKDGVFPHILNFHDFAEDYDKGKRTSRSCVDLSGAWVYNGRLFNGQPQPAEWLEKFMESVRVNLLNEMGIWSGAFYPDAGTEFLFLTEFNSFHDTAETP